MRYVEEVEPLLEEMRRSSSGIETTGRSVRSAFANGLTAIPTLAPSPTQGSTAAFEEAYALCQAAVRQRLFNTFTQQWHDVPAFIALNDRGLADEEIVGDSTQGSQSP